MCDQSYSGWKNWDTWNVIVWLENEQEANLFARAAAQESSMDLDAFADYAFGVCLAKARCTDKDDLSKFRVDWKAVRNRLCAE